MAEESNATTQPSSNNDQHAVSVKLSGCFRNSKGYPKPLSRPSCPICFLTLPIFQTETVYKACCGTMICRGCTHQNALAMESRDQEVSCPFCRQTAPSDSKTCEKWLKKRVEEFNDPIAMFNLSARYKYGIGSFPKNPRKEVSLLRQAAGLGDPQAACNLALYYKDGYPEGGIQANHDTCMEYLKVAAYRGAEVYAWHNLGVFYLEEGNIEAGNYHFQAAAAYGYEGSLEAVKIGYKLGSISKEEFADTLRAWQASTDDMKSEGREK